MVALIKKYPETSPKSLCHAVPETSPLNPLETRADVFKVLQ